MAAPVDTALLSPVVLFWLVWNYTSTMGENYFMDIITINGMKSAATSMRVADALSKVLAGVLQPTPGHRWRDMNFKLAILPSLIDALGKFFIMSGVAIAGAQARAILGTSTTIWSAVLSYFSLGRVVSPLQWSGIVTIMVGVLVKRDWSNAFSKEGDKVALGMFSILIGMMLHVGSGVVVEYFSRKCSLPAPKLGCVMGLINLVIMSVEVVCSMTNWQDGVLKVEADFDLMRFNDGKGFFFGAGSGIAWLGLLFFSTIHYSAYFNLLGTVGLVTITTQKSLVTVGYVALSAISFCNKDNKGLREYCITQEFLSYPPFIPGTVPSALTCLAGVILYSYATHLKDVREASGVQTSKSFLDEAADALAEKGEKKDYDSQSDAGSRITGVVPRGYGSATAGNA